MNEQPLPLETDPTTVKKLLDEQAEFLFVDCREPSEHQTANIPAAKLLPMGEITTKVSELGEDRQRHIVVHCHHGGRSMRVTEWLRSQGYENVQSMAGGIDLWSQQIDSSIPRY